MGHGPLTIVKGRDIVVVSIQPWYYELGSNCKNIATKFSEYNRVLYVNIPITRKTYFSKQKTQGVQEHCNIIKEKRDRIKQIKENMWEFYPTTLIESINSLPSTTLFRLFNKINNRRFAKDIQQGIKQMGFKDVILFNDNDIYNGFHLKELIRPDLYIYYMRDFLQGYAYWKKHSTVLEPKLIAKADLVVANSTYYAEYSSGFNPNSYYIGQGCNLDLFDAQKTYPVPEEIRGLSSPLIGYVGALDSSRLDLRAIEMIAKANPAWNVVLVGPEDEPFRQSNLHQLPNIHFIGRKPMAELPAYVAAFDVCLNPQQINDITKGNYPLKIDEYLAMGKSIVATRTAAMKIFEPYTWLADQPSDYPGLIEKALQKTSQEVKDQRINFAKSHTWENSMKELYKAINMVR